MESVSLNPLYYPLYAETLNKCERQNNLEIKERLVIYIYPKIATNIFSFFYEQLRCI